jgi:hypothetical protein
MTVESRERMVEIVKVGVLGGEEGVEQYVEEAMFGEINKEQVLGAVNTL